MLRAEAVPKNLAKEALSSAGARNIPMSGVANTRHCISHQQARTKVLRNTCLIVAFFVLWQSSSWKDVRSLCWTAERATAPTLRTCSWLASGLVV